MKRAKPVKADPFNLVKKKVGCAYCGFKKFHSTNKGTRCLRCGRLTK